MIKNKNYNMYIFVLIVMVVILLSVKIVDYRLEILHKQEIEKEIRLNTNDMYKKYLYIKGNGAYLGNKIIYESMEITDSNQLYVDVAFYNFFNNEGNHTDVDESLDEYDNFCNNTGTWDNLQAYCHFEYGDNDYNTVGWYEKYIYNVTKYLLKTMII